MTQPFIALLYLAVMAAVVVGVDVRFLQRHGMRRLVVNVLIVVGFLLVYVAIVGHP